MTQLAQYLGKLIRERGGTLPSHDQWLEAKASEIRNMVYREDHDQEILDELICDGIIVKWNINDNKKRIFSTINNEHPIKWIGLGCVIGEIGEEWKPKIVISDNKIIRT